jgi:hypothetical protein
VFVPGKELISIEELRYEDMKGCGDPLFFFSWAVAGIGKKCSSDYRSFLTSFFMPNSYPPLSLILSSLLIMTSQSFESEFRW